HRTRRDGIFLPPELTTSSVSSQMMRRLLLGMMALIWLGLSVSLSLRADGPKSDATPRPVDYGREIKPLLADRCYACHGPDKGQRKAGLRLDLRDEAVKSVIKPGKAAESELIQRIGSHDAQQVMPPPKSKKQPLNLAQIKLLERWIDEGAKYEEHWAYRPL